MRKQLTQLLYSRALTVLVPLAAVLLLAAGCGKETYPTPTPPNSAATPTKGLIATATGGQQVAATIQNSKHQNVTVKVGDTVTWTNKDSFQHTVTAGKPGAVNNEFRSGNIGAGGTFSHTFTTPGTYIYFCEIHTNMTATVTVTR